MIDSVLVEVSAGDFKPTLCAISLRSNKPLDLCRRFNFPVRSQTHARRKIPFFRANLANSSYSPVLRLRTSAGIGKSFAIILLFLFAPPEKKEKKSQAPKLKVTAGPSTTCV